MISDRAANIITGVVTAIWAGNILLAMASALTGAFVYTPSVEVNGIFLTLVGGAFALRARTKAENGAEK